MNLLRPEIKCASDRRRAFTLPEVLISAAIASILMLGIASSLKFATVAAEDAGTSSASDAATVDVLDRVTTDLKEATSFVVRQSNRLDFLVPDRNGDGIADELDYSWSGVSGAPLLFRLNGGTAVTLASNVTYFDLDYVYRTLSPPLGACCLTDGTCADETQADCGALSGALYKGDGTECATSQCLVESPVVVLSSYTATPNSPVALTTTAWKCQYFMPVLPANTVSWKITSVGALLKRATSSSTGNVIIEIRAADAAEKPTGSALASTSVSVSSFATTDTWVDSALTLPGLSPSAGVTMVVYSNKSTANAYIELKTGISPALSGLSECYSTNSGSTWTAPARTSAKIFRIYGTYTTLGPPQ